MKIYLIFFFSDTSSWMQTSWIALTDKIWYFFDVPIRGRDSIENCIRFVSILWIPNAMQWMILNWWIFRFVIANGNDARIYLMSSSTKKRIYFCRTIHQLTWVLHPKKVRQLFIFGMSQNDEVHCKQSSKVIICFCFLFVSAVLLPHNVSMRRLIVWLALKCLINYV